MPEIKKTTIGDFMKDQGLVLDKGEVKKSEKLSEETKKMEANDLKKMMEDPNYDPINKKSYSGEAFEKKPEIPFSRYNKNESPEFLENLPETFEDPSDIYENLDEYNLDPKTIDEFTNEDSLYSFTKKENNIDNFNDTDQDDKLGDFEKTDVIDYDDIREKREFKDQKEKREKKRLQMIPKYTDFEKNSLQEVVKNYINQKEQFVGERKLSEEQINEAMDEFKQNFPEDFAKMIHKKIMTGDFKWKKETFKDKKILVNYYPSPEEPIIKYVLNLNDKDSGKKDPITKVFINNSVKEDGKVFKDKEGAVLVFCSKPIKKLEIKK